MSSPSDADPYTGNYYVVPTQRDGQAHQPCVYFREVSAAPPTWERVWPPVVFYSVPPDPTDPTSTPSINLFLATAAELESQGHHILDVRIDASLTLSGVVATPCVVDGAALETFYPATTDGTAVADITTAETLRGIALIFLGPAPSDGGPPPLYCSIDPEIQNGVHQSPGR